MMYYCGMKNGPDIAALAALIGDPARANMLTSLMGGQAWTAGELARVGGIAAPTASGHLAQLLAGGLLAVEKQGRHRYYRLAGAEVATAIEALMDLAQYPQPHRTRPGPKESEMRKARVCYDHLAGERGVELFTRLTARKMIEFQDGAIGMTARGESEIHAFGIDMGALKAARRPLCKTCLDWSERRSHLAGSLGAALLCRFFELHWVRRVESTRAVRFTPCGEAAFGKLFE
jgi:DNA-binding transcriptional ArsR family regulator